jgi:hypothetical protein
MYEYNRQSNKEEAKEEDAFREKKDLRDQVDSIAFTVEQQSAQIRELSRITIALTDDLHKATQKHKGFLGLGASTETKLEEEAKHVNFELCQERDPIMSAVLQMNLHSV